MSLAPGIRLGPYEIVAPLGAGGMGEVYRARDTRLAREVAVKVLPQHLSSNPETRARFEREAKTVSSLNHPHICTLYDVGREGHTDYLVMELVEGETLAARLAKGALPAADVLKFGAQIADALDRAHRAGVIHRDLKPGNVMLTKSGAKLLDFGLARASGMAGPGGESGMSRTAMGQSPTVADPLTAEGAIVGTFQYMAPEQLEGREADPRADLWALGCVLYEMATGKRAFDGATQASLISAIMRDVPRPMSQLVPMSPPALERLVSALLAKDPDDRLQSAHDVKVQLSWMAAGDSQAEAPVAVVRRGRPAFPIWAMAVAFLALGTAIGWFGWSRKHGARAGGSGIASSRVTTMAPLTDMPGRQYSPSLSPDGKMLLYVALGGADEDIFLLRVGGENPVNLTESHSGADYAPAFAPDGEHIAFCSERDGGGIFVMGATGESPKKLTSEGAHPAWSPDGRRIVYSSERVTGPYQRNTTSSLWVVDVTTGEKQRIYDGDAVAPAWSPSGGRIAFWAADQGQRDIKTIPAGGGPATAVTKDRPADWNPFWAPGGGALFMLSDRAGSPNLWRVAIDEASGEVRGEPEPVTIGVARVMAGTISADGQRVAVTIDEARGDILRMAFDPVAARPQGAPVSIFASASEVLQMSITTDGRSIVYRTRAPIENLYVMRSDGTERRRLTDDAFRNRGPRWIRGDWLVFYSNRSGGYELWLMRQDGTELRTLTNRPELDVSLPLVSPDGTRIAFSMTSPGGLPKVAIARVEDSWFAPGKVPEPIGFEGIADAFQATAWSQDGKRMAGALITPQGLVPAIYTIASGRVEPETSLAGAYGSAGMGSLVTWLPDNRRTLLWDDRRGTAVLWDVDTGAIRDVAGIPGPSEMQLSADGRTLILNRSVLEGDVWLLTLK